MAGDFIILHPFMLHASSNNKLRVPRWMTNPPILLKEPMNLNRERGPALLALAITALGLKGVVEGCIAPTRSVRASGRRRAGTAFSAFSSTRRA